MKTVGGMRRPMRRGTERIGWCFTFVAAAYNLVRLPKLLAQAACRSRRVGPRRCAIVGRWRIVEADLWDRAFLDLCGPATLVAGADEYGEISFGTVQVGLNIAYGPDDIAFDRCGFDEMDEVQGSDSAELQDDGTLTIDFAYHLGDEAVLKAVPETSSAAC